MQSRMWRNWQTRMVQVHVKAISWGFKSLHPHQRRLIVLIREYLKLSALFFCRKSLQDRGFRLFLFLSKFHCAVSSTVFAGNQAQFLFSAELAMKLFQGKSFIVPVKVSLSEEKFHRELRVSERSLQTYTSIYPVLLVVSIKTLSLIQKKKPSPVRDGPKRA